MTEYLVLTGISLTNIQQLERPPFWIVSKARLTMATPPKPFLQRRRHHLLFIPSPVVVALLAFSLAPLPPFSFKGHIVVGNQ